MKKIDVIILGCGSRGKAYADYIRAHSDDARIVAIAEPREDYAKIIADEHGLREEMIFTDWKQVAELDRFADAVIIATQDKMHLEPTLAFASKGYDILLEKPMSVREQECVEIVDAVKDAGVLFAVCHVLRYTPHTVKLKEILDRGAIGEIVSVEHLEPIGFWHFAHSFVRGNWGHEKNSTFSLMSKSCHDVDWLSYIVDSKFAKVSSFGGLRHFRKENKPQGVSSWCIDCACEHDCPYSAKRIYLDRAESGNFDWPVDVLTVDKDVDAVRKAIMQGPYGRCVYECDNDVCDNQIVNFECENGINVSFTMTAFSEMADRKTRLFGTRGEIETDGSVIKVYDFLTGKKEAVIANDTDGSILSGHGGGDWGLMKAFVSAVREKSPGKILSGPNETLRSHLAVFAAEKSRKTRVVVNFNNA
jgi:predicted dehydrogenase